MEKFMLTVNFVVLVAGIVTIIWFFKDMRRENGKLLKEITQILRDHTQLFNEIILLLKSR
ncbi:MAG: hypothetical protein QME68_04175 [Elusimicrobiota bacterium]|nr:hypothetical protein [Elusimicrobiota bacterium]